jgi:type IV pilus assembly protein PilQ
MKRSTSSPIRTARALLVALTVAFGTSGAVAGAEGSNRIREVKVSQAPGQTQITVKGSKRPTYTAFKLGTPLRLVVDLADSEVRGVPAVLQAATDLVDGVAVSQFTSGGVAVSRVVVNFRQEAGYRVSVNGSDLVITLRGQTARGSEPEPDDRTAAEIERLRVESESSRQAAERAANEARTAEAALAEARAEQAAREGTLTAGARAAKARAEEQIAQLRADHEQAQAQVTAERTKRETLERRLADLQTRLDAAQSARTEAETARAAAEAEAEMVKSRILAQVTAEKSAKDAAKEALAAQRAAAEAYRRAAESEKADLQAVLERREKETVQAKRALSAAEEARQRTGKDLQNALAKLRKATDEERVAARAQSQVAWKTERELRTAEQKLGEARDAARLAGQRAEQAAAARVSLEREIDRIRAEASAKNSEAERKAAERIAAAEQRLAAAEKAQAELRTRNAAIAERLAAAEAAVVASQQRAAGFELESAGLRARAGSAEERLAGLEQKLKDAERQAVDARRLVTDRERELTSIRGRAGFAEERISTYERQLAVARGEAEQAQLRVEEFEREISGAGRRIADQARQIGDLERLAGNAERKAAEAKAAEARAAEAAAEARAAQVKVTQATAAEVKAAEEKATQANATARAAEEKAAKASAEARAAEAKAARAIAAATAAQVKVTRATAAEVKAAEEKAAKASAEARAAEAKAARAIAAATAAQVKVTRATAAEVKAAEEKAAKASAEARAAEAKAARAIAAATAAEEKAAGAVAAARAAEEKAAGAIAAAQAQAAARAQAPAQAQAQARTRPLTAETLAARRKTQEELRLERLNAMHGRKDQAPPATTAVSKPTGPAITDIQFIDERGAQKVVIRTSGDLEYSRSDDHKGNAVLSFAGASLPQMLERTLDVTDFGGVVDRVSSYSEGDGVRIEVEVAEATASDLERGEGVIAWTFKERSPKKAAVAAGKSGRPASKTVIREEAAAYEYPLERTAAYSVQLQGKGTKKKAYTGRRIDLDFKDADIHNILRLLSDVGQVNIVTADDVSGTVTIRMRDVPWDHALDVILQAKRFGMVRQGNLIRVAPMATLEKELELEIARRRQNEALEPLETRLIPVSYAQADEIKPRAADMLSERGKLSVDVRTNVIIARDVAAALDQIEALIRNLDTQTPQVLIEGRIVEASSTYAREIGIQWGGDFSASSATGNPTGLAFPSTIGMAGGGTDSQTPTAGLSPIAGGQPNPNFAVNLPAATGTNSGGALGITLGSISNNANLNLRLSALEEEGTLRILSSPKILTLDNREAHIEQGTLIPYSRISAQGIQTSFKEAKLNLTVTPHVTADGSVLLNLKMTRDEPDFNNKGARGDPTILKREAQTQLLVNDGHTAVIGGIFTRNHGTSYKKVPFFGDIPVLGWLFKKRSDSDRRSEMLIFITPRIVNRAESIGQ